MLNSFNTNFSSIMLKINIIFKKLNIGFCYPIGDSIGSVYSVVWNTDVPKFFSSVSDAP